VKLEYDSRGNRFITDCQIHYFEGKGQFFTLQAFSGEIIAAPNFQNQYMGQPIETTINELKKQGFKHQLI
jgi:hypothetical protein